MFIAFFRQVTIFPVILYVYLKSLRQPRRPLTGREAGLRGRGDVRRHMLV